MIRNKALLVIEFLIFQLENNVIDSIDERSKNGEIILFRFLRGKRSKK